MKTLLLFLRGIGRLSTVIFAIYLLNPARRPLSHDGFDRSTFLDHDRDYLELPFVPDEPHEMALEASFDDDGLCLNRPDVDDLSWGSSIKDWDDDFPSKFKTEWGDELPAKDIALALLGLSGGHWRGPQREPGDLLTTPEELWAKYRR